MDVIAHEHVGMYAQAFMHNAVVETIHHNIPVYLPCENICPLDDGWCAKIGGFLVCDFVAGAHGG